MDPTLILLRSWDPTGASSDLEMVPYPTLWLESCDAYGASYVLVSYTMVKEVYFSHHITMSNISILLCLLLMLTI